VKGCISFKTMILTNSNFNTKSLIFWVLANLLFLLLNRIQKLVIRHGNTKAQKCVFFR